MHLRIVGTSSRGRQVLGGMASCCRSNPDILRNLLTWKSESWSWGWWDKGQQVKQTGYRYWGPFFLTVRPKGQSTSKVTVNCPPVRYQAWKKALARARTVQGAWTGSKLATCKFPEFGVASPQALFSLVSSGSCLVHLSRYFGSMILWVVPP